ncbi:hypothetical protein EDD15DRAFT_2203705 [Pisolithus albus]|nr:hypothetical protein EDD15DRAFT_2203705 [Pisolithus albus]
MPDKVVTLKEYRRVQHVQNSLNSDVPTNSLVKLPSFTVTIDNSSFTASMTSSDQPESPANDSTTLFQPAGSITGLPELLGRSESPRQSRAPLTLESTSSVVPETPGADLSVSLSSINVEPGSFSQAKLSVPSRGTPSAVGALSIRRKAMINPPYVGTPLRNAWLGATPGKLHDLNADVQAVLGKRLKTDSDYSDPADIDNEEFDQKEAFLLLDVVRAQAVVRRLERQLMDAKIDENVALGSLYRCRAQESERRLEDAEAEFGCIRNSIRMSGGSSTDASIRLWTLWCTVWLTLLSVLFQKQRFADG